MGQMIHDAVNELNPGIFQIRGLKGSSHSYVIKGEYMNVMIDTGSDQNFPVLERGLRHIGMKVRDVNLVINSHEHCDHIGANRYFQETAMIAAYRLAASKMTTGDYYVTMYKGNDLNELALFRCDETHVPNCDQLPDDTNAWTFVDLCSNLVGMGGAGQ
jgi:glyoxylase-like metal-dependent hydrolase (beta-lactamase superfamily II)